MTLVSSGTLYLTAEAGLSTRSIAHACTGDYNPYSLTTAQGVAASYVGTLPVNMTDFYGFPPGSTVTFNNSAIHYELVDEVDRQDYYTEVIFTGMQSWDIVDINLRVTLYNSGIPNGIVGKAYYSRNSITSWVTLSTLIADGYEDVSVDDIEYSDTIRIRLEVYSLPGGAGYLRYGLSSGVFVVGSGTIVPVTPSVYQLNLPG